MGSSHSNGTASPRCSPTRIRAIRNSWLRSTLRAFHRLPSGSCCFARSYKVSSSACCLRSSGLQRFLRKQHYSYLLTLVTYILAEDAQGVRLDSIPLWSELLVQHGFTILQDAEQHEGLARRLQIGTRNTPDRLICIQAIQLDRFVVTTDRHMWECSAVKTLAD